MISRFKAEQEIIFHTTTDIIIDNGRVTVESNDLNLEEEGKVLIVSNYKIQIRKENNRTNENQSSEEHFLFQEIKKSRHVQLVYQLEMEQEVGYKYERLQHL